MDKRHTYDSGIVGNCSYVAHVDQRANINWLCWPRFDSSFIFGTLLDSEKGGHFYISPAEEKFHSKQYYLENTNVLCTEFDSPSGRFRVVDFAPRFHLYERYYKPLMLFRRIELLSGSPNVRVSCQPKGEYGAIDLESSLGSNHIRYSGMENQVRLTTDIPLNYILTERVFVLNEDKDIVLSFGTPLEAPLRATMSEFLGKTIRYWQEWVKRCSLGNFHQKAVLRSALILKLHQYEDTGAIIASSTTSLPEHPGSGRTWDYRYCWMRDSYYTLNAFNSIGHFDELERYVQYIQNVAISSQDRYHPVYNLVGDLDFKERSLDLEGYQKNQPVRIGNEARNHVQNDVYGQILVSILPLYLDRRFTEMESRRNPNLISDVLLGIEKTIDDPDAGLWEFRNKSQKHCYTFLFHWAGASAAEKIAKKFNDEKMVKKAKELRERAIRNIESCFDSSLGAYTQAQGTKNLDASLLQLIAMDYLDPRSERAAEHLKVLERELVTKDSLMYRYKHEDDFGKPKSTFLVCAFWYVEALACVGRVEDAIRHFEHLLTYSNHLGLLSEDVETGNGSQWGNFPQTYSHVGLVNAAFRISTKVDKPLFR